jgi:hypothetical protein
MLRIRSVVIQGLVIFLSLVAAGCGEDGETTSSPTPAPAPVPTPAPAPQPEAEPATPDMSAYPYTQDEALSLIEAGYPMAGLLSNGLEVLNMRSEETVEEELPEQELVCDYRYDDDLREETNECLNETVYKDRPVTKTVYLMRGAIGSAKFSLASDPFWRAVAAGAVHWRRG